MSHCIKGHDLGHDADGHEGEKAACANTHTKPGCCIIAASSYKLIEQAALHKLHLHLSVRSSDNFK